MQALLIASRTSSVPAPLTNALPALLVPIVNRPLVAITLELLARAGVRQVTLVLHPNDAVVAEYCRGGERWGIALNIVWDAAAPGQRGVLGKVVEHITEPCLVLPSDDLLDLEFSQVYAYHQSQAAPVTRILMSAQADQSNAVAIEDRKLVSVGYLVQPEVLRELANTFGAIADGLQALQANNYVPLGFWQPLDTLAAYQEAQRAYLNSAWRTEQQTVARIRHTPMEGTQIANGVWVGKHSIISPDARLTPPIYIGENCRIFPGVELGPNTVLGDNVVVDREATVVRSTVWNDTYIGRLVRSSDRLISGATIVDPESGAFMRVTDAFLLADVNSIRQRLRLRRRLRGLRARIAGLIGKKIVDDPEVYEPMDNLRRV